MPNFLWLSRRLWLGSFISIKWTNQCPCSYDVVADAPRSNSADFERFVRVRVPPEEADDVAQIAAMRALEHADSLKDPERVIALVYRTHRNVITDILRSRACEQRLVSKSTDIPERPQPQKEDWCGCSVTIPAMREFWGSLMSRKSPSPKWRAPLASQSIT